MTALENIASMLAEAGMSLSEKTRLAFGAPVLKALSEANVSKVFVAVSKDSKVMDLQAKLSDDARKTVRFVDAREYEYAPVRAHIVNFAKSRKVKLATATIKDADDNVVGFTVAKTK